jgi:hypothetical protein
LKSLQTSDLAQRATGVPNFFFHRPIAGPNRPLTQRCSHPSEIICDIFTLTAYLFKKVTGTFVVGQ